MAVVFLSDVLRRRGGACLRRPRTLFEKRVLGTPKNFNKRILYLKFFGIQNLSFKKGFGGVKGQSPLRSLNE
jgi:hypothetical protein